MFGVSSAIQHLDDALRVRVVAASSAMWIVPALVGPPATLALEHLVGWRWTLLVPVPVVLIGRVLIMRAARPDKDEERQDRPLWRTLLVSIGVAALVLSGGHRSWWPVAAVGTGIAFAGVAAIMPAGTIRLRRGTPAALGGMLWFATGYFGATAVITAEAFGGVLGQAAGGAVVWLSATVGLPRSDGLTAAYGMFALFLLASAMAAARSTPTSTRRSCGPWRWRNSSPPTCSEGGDASTKVATPIGWEVER